MAWMHFPEKKIIAFLPLKRCFGKPCQQSGEWSANGMMLGSTCLAFLLDVPPPCADVIRAIRSLDITGHSPNPLSCLGTQGVCIRNIFVSQLKSELKPRDGFQVTEVSANCSKTCQNPNTQVSWIVMPCLSPTNLHWNRPPLANEVVAVKRRQC